MTVPSGAISTAVSRLETMLSESTSFQSWVGASDATDAKNYIFHRAYEGSVYPNAVIDDSGVSFVPIAIDTWKLEGIFGIYFSAEMDAVDLGDDDEITDYKEVFTKFTNDLGAIIEDLYSAANTSGNLIIREPGIVPDGQPTIDDHDYTDNVPRSIWLKYDITFG